MLSRKFSTKARTNLTVPRSAKFGTSRRRRRRICRYSYVRRHRLSCVRHAAGAQEGNGPALLPLAGSGFREGVQGNLSWNQAVIPFVRRSCASGCAITDTGLPPQGPGAPWKGAFSWLVRIPPSNCRHTDNRIMPRLLAAQDFEAPGRFAGVIGMITSSRYLSADSGIIAP